MKTTIRFAALSAAAIPLFAGCVETRVVPVESEPPAPPPSVSVAPAPAPAYTYDQAAYPPTAAPAAEPAAVAEPAPAPALAPVYVSSPPVEVTYFYNELSPYGTWAELPGYGWCWQPTVVALNRGWRPYCDSGHWVWTDAGWCWVSDYTWGWAPFHYGRWLLHERNGWVWVPDRVWGPAWVTWRSAGDSCGWAPLPPHADFDVRLGWSFNGARVAVDFDFGLRPDHFTFVTLDHFRDHDFGPRRLPPAEVTRIYNHTTIINNYTVNNTTIVNRGIAVERVAAATHTQIHQAAIRELPAGAARGPHASADKNETVVYRPQLQAPAQSTRMVAQKLDERHPVIQHSTPRPATPEQKPVVRNNAPGPGPAPHATQAEAPKAPVRPPVETPPVHHETAHAPAPQPPPAAAPPVRMAHATPPAVTPPAPVRPTTEPKQAVRSTTAYHPEPGADLHPLRTAVPPQPAQGKTLPPEQNTHVYPPKSAHQAAEAHALPPLNPRPVTAPTSSSKDAATQKNKGNNHNEER